MPSFLQHNLHLVVSGHCLHVSVTKFQDKFASLRQGNSPYIAEISSNMLYRHVFDKISTEFHGILSCFCEFHGILQIYFNSVASVTARNIRSSVKGTIISVLQ